jgi:hypothetical protein
MTHSLIAPRGIFVPTHIIFHSQLPASVRITWIQLRCLAWDGWSTPPLTLPELASLLGIHPTRLYRHLSQLKRITALSWRTGNNGKLVVSFPGEPPVTPHEQVEVAASPAVTTPDTGHSALPVPDSYFPRRILGYLSFEADQDICTNLDPSDNQHPGIPLGNRDIFRFKHCIPYQDVK